jgi:hypothetical protein
MVRARAAGEFGSINRPQLQGLKDVRLLVVGNEQKGGQTTASYRKRRSRCRNQSSEMHCTDSQYYRDVIDDRGEVT